MATKIAPSILSADFANMARDIESCYKWGADILHCDVMDGVFVNNITFGMPMIEALAKTSKLPLDCHLMIVSPEKYVERFVKAGANFVTFHPNVCSDIKNTIKIIKDNGAKAGLVINPDVDVRSISEYLDDIDMILLMSVFPGFGGQKFIESTIDKIKLTKELIGNRNILIEIDGGVSESNAKRIVEAGADILVAGSAVFKSSNPTKTIEILRS